MNLKHLYKNWLFWFKKQPRSLKWFLWLILLMPFISIFYDIGGEGALSPLQIVGTLSFFISLYHIITKRIKLLPYEIYFLIFSFIYILNHLFFFLNDLSLNNLGFVLRNVLPILFYFYLRRVVTSKAVFEGILLTFLVSSIFPYGTYLYEFFFSPIQEVYVSESRGGFVRLTGFYADLFSYMAYIVGDFIIVSYFILKNGNKFKTHHILLLFGTTFIGIAGLSHQSSWAVFVSILLLLLFYMKKSRLLKKILPYLIVVSLLGGPFFVNKFIKPLFAKEINAYEGKADKERMLNGRMIRWQQYFKIWEDMSSFNKAFGVGFSGSVHSKSMMSGGMHSDYIRLGFGAGIFGLISYLLFYKSVLFRRRKFYKSISFIVTSSIIIMLLYAVSANPLGSSGALIYLTLATFSFVANNKIYGYR